MKKIYSIIIALLCFVGIANAAEVVEAGKRYDITTTGNVDIEFDTTEEVPNGKNVVVFYYTSDPSHPFLFGTNYKDCKYSNENGYVRMWCELAHNLNTNGTEHLNIYGPVAAGEYWCYTICDASEVETVKSPLGGGDDPEPEAVPGQDEEHAIVLTKGTSTDFSSFNNGQRNVLYVKFTAETTGTVTMNLSEPNTYAKWMEDGVMAYGKLKQNEFKDGNQFQAEKGKTYYCLYNFASAVNGSISYNITEAQPGEARSTAITINGNGTQNLFGKAPEDTGEKDTETGRPIYKYFNITTWYKLNRSSLAGNGAMTITIAGGNQTTVSLYANNDTEPVKIYMMGSGSGMLPVNSTVVFDINLASNDYYVAIDQDNANGKATFAFSASAPGQTLNTAIDANLGDNTVDTNKWYKYTNNADKVITIKGVNIVYDENERLVAEGADATSVGFRMQSGETVYFVPTSATVKISARDIEDGEYADKPLVITTEPFSFTLSNGSSDTQRYMQYTATADGTFMYGTSNTTVVTSAFGAMVKDNGTRIDITSEERNYGETMFVYEWNVQKGHTYLIEQTLQNGMGTVEFQAVFTGTAGITTLNAQNASTAAYNLVGQRVASSAKGIIIKNGKKYIAE